MRSRLIFLTAPAGILIWRQSALPPSVPGAAKSACWFASSARTTSSGAPAAHDPLTQKESSDHPLGADDFNFWLSVATPSGTTTNRARYASPLPPRPQPPPVTAPCITQPSDASATGAAPKGTLSNILSNDSTSVARCGRTSAGGRDPRPGGPRAPPPPPARRPPDGGG